MLGLIIFYYIMVFIFVGIYGSMALIVDTDIIPDHGKVNFLKLIFMYQYAVYKLAEDSINIVGIILLELLTTLSVWFLNVIVLVTICGYYLVIFICKAFYFVFRKR